MKTEKYLLFEEVADTGDQRDPQSSYYSAVQ